MAVTSWHAIWPYGQTCPHQNDPTKPSHLVYSVAVYAVGSTTWCTKHRHNICVSASQRCSVTGEIDDILRLSIGHPNCCFTCVLTTKFVCLLPTFFEWLATSSAATWALLFVLQQDVVSSRGWCGDIMWWTESPDGQCRTCKETTSSSVWRQMAR